MRFREDKEKKEEEKSADKILIKTLYNEIIHLDKSPKLPYSIPTVYSW